MKQIIFYKTHRDGSPIEKFLNSLASKQAQKVTWVMKLVEDMEKIPEQYFKKLINTDDIWEIRAQLGSNIFRILGFFKDAIYFVATNGFQKKTQKPPLNEIKLAEKRKVEYIKRVKVNE